MTPTLASSVMRLFPTVIGSRTRARIAFREPQRLIDVVDPAQRDEFVAAETGDDVVHPQSGREAMAERDEHLVADVVAHVVVDFLEPVEVDEEHGDRLVRCGRW